MLNSEEARHMGERTAYLLAETPYQTLKWTGLILCPALAWLVSEVGPAWGYDATPVVKTINAVGTFIGLLIGASQLSTIGGK